MTKREPLHPVRWIADRLEDGTIARSLMIDAGGVTDFDDAFEAVGLEASGHEWRRVVEALVQRDLPSLAARVTFDSESDAMLVYLTHEEDQRTLAQAIHDVCADAHALRALLAALPPRVTAEAPAPATTKKPTKKATKKPTKKPTKKATKKATKKPTKKATKKPTKKTAR